MPYLGTLGIMDEGTPCMIPTVNVKTSVPTLSAFQLWNLQREIPDGLVISPRKAFFNLISSIRIRVVLKQQRKSGGPGIGPRIRIKPACQNG